MRRRLLVVLVPALALSTPAAADGAAGTAKAKKIWESDGAIREDYTRHVAQLVYRGEPGRASDLTVRFHGRRVTLSDPHGITAGRNCRQLGPDRVRCRLRGPKPQYRPGADLALGGGDDVVRLRGRPWAGTTEVDLGRGDDRVAGSDGRDLIDDGGGRDRVQGGRGADHLFAGGRRNGADDLAGGRGRDTLGYWRRRAPVHVDLAGDADDGAAGERDRVRPGLERIVGGTGSDELVGGPGDDDLDGGSDHGVDVLLGGEGDDRLRTHAAGGRIDGGGGDDLVFSNFAGTYDGGAGRDAIGAGQGSTILADDGEPDELHCRGTAVADGLDLVLGCETVTRSAPASPRFLFSRRWVGGELTGGIRRRVLRLRRTLGAAVACSVDMPVPCRVQVQLRDSRRTLFSLSGTVQVGSFLDFSAIVDRSERRSLRGRDYTLRLEGTDAAGARVVIEERDLRAG